jgi:hypothetical protein
MEETPDFVRGDEGKTGICPGRCSKTPAQCGANPGLLQPLMGFDGCLGGKHKIRGRPPCAVRQSEGLSQEQE